MNFTELLRSVKIKKSGRSTIISSDVEQGKATLIDYRDFANWHQSKLQLGEITRHLRIDLKQSGLLNYLFVDKSLICLNASNLSFHEIEFRAEGYFVFRLIFSGVLEETTLSSKRDFSNLECSTLNLSHSKLGWRARASNEKAVTEIVLFLHSNRIPALTSTLSTTEPGQSDQGQSLLSESFAISSISPSPNLIDFGRKLLELDFADTYAPLLCEGLATAIVAEVLHSIEQSEKQPSSATRISVRDMDLLNKAKLFIESHYQSEITIPQLAAEIGVNRRKLTEGFRYIFGTTVYGFTLQQRMKNAKALLSEDLPLDVVAHSTGYSSESSFSRAFKKYTGVSPSRFQKSFK